MRSLRRVAAVLAAAGVLGACQAPLMKADERDQACRFAVVTAPDALQPRRNPMDDPVAGPALGAGMGTLLLAGALVASPYVFLAPAIVSHGIGCGVGSVAHPNAAADFQRAFAAADVTVLARSLESSLDAPRPACTSRPATPAADVVVTLQKIEPAPGCAYGDWDYSIWVTWRATRADGAEVVPERRLQCTHGSQRDFDAWFGDPALARQEIEQVLAAIGARIAQDLLADEAPQKSCVLRSSQGRLLDR